jgi:phosphoribosylaminoimidazolecarboxamide formyltransferase/IMP cyclohydrolase
LESEITPEIKKRLAVRAINRLADYRSTIAVELSQMLIARDSLRLSFKSGRKLGRYGENWHQQAWYYGKYVEQLAGPELGYNNYLDMDAAFNSVLDLKGCGVSVVKHSNPCGYATGHTLKQALKRAWEGDDISAFGSIIAFTKKLDAETAGFLQGRFVEVLVVPDIEPKALEMLRAKKSLRVIRRDPGMGVLDYRGVEGGMLIQDRDKGLYLGNLSDRKQVDGRLTGLVTKKEMKAGRGLIEFAIKAVKHLKSNAICICHEYEKGLYMLLGMGCGQPNRLNSVRLAVDKAVYNLKKRYSDAEASKILEKAVLSSDAFFPFSDSIEEIAHQGIVQVVQPGGSIRDQEVIGKCDELGIAMVFTGMRHFRH